MAEDKKKLKKEAIEWINSEMKSDDRFIKYFEAYTENSVAAFIKNYADAKATPSGASL
jgi:hypothetical protein